MDEETRKALQLLTSEAVTSALFRVGFLRQAGEAVPKAAEMFGIDLQGRTSADLQGAVDRRLAALRELQQQLEADPS